jgi:hypothetical protein
MKLSDTDYLRLRRAIALEQLIMRSKPIDRPLTAACSKGVTMSDQSRHPPPLPEQAYMLHSRNPTRPLSNTAHQGRPSIAVAAKGIDAPSLILIAVIGCLCLLASLWAAVSGCDLSANWL